MIAWLSEWLRSIIAVMLLAVFVELLIPNKAMLRYARLVIGLFILLTVMTPLLKLVQGDLEKSLAGGFRTWEANFAEREVKMPALDDIKREAEKLSGRQAASAAKLTGRMLELSIKQRVEAETGAGVADVSVKLDAKGERVQSVVLTLYAEAEEPAEESAPKGVEPVSVGIEVERVSAPAVLPEQESSTGQTEPERKVWKQADAVLDESIRKMLLQQYDIDPAIVTVRQPADSKAKSERR